MVSGGRSQKFHPDSFMKNGICKQGINSAVPVLMSRNYFWDQLRSAKCLVNVKTFSVLMSCPSRSCHSSQRASCRNCSGLSTFHIHTQPWLWAPSGCGPDPSHVAQTCKYDTNFSSAKYFYRKMLSSEGRRTLPAAIKMPLKIWHFHIAANRKFHLMTILLFVMRWGRTRSWENKPISHHPATE